MIKTPLVRMTDLAKPIDDEFKDIRPYRDDEVRQVLARLLNDKDLLEVVARFRFPRVYGWAPAVLRALVQRQLSARTRPIESVGQFQQFLEDFMIRMVRETTDGFTFSGTEGLRPDVGYLFVGNHRDIAMDSGLMQYALYQARLPTSRIAIGDNLLQRPYATDLMRLNKSFVVRRNLTGVKEMAAAFQLTSRYLHHSIGEHVSVWIAQREGRAKDGVDRTDPAIIKMFHVSQRKSGKSFGAVMASLNIVPVAVSYELDPCDDMKAKELAITARGERYQKPEGEDLQSIVRGIIGYKGRVHFSFGTPLPSTFDDAEAVAAQIDQQIITMYRLWPTHFWCARECGVDADSLAIESTNERALQELKRRVTEASAEHRPWLLAQYANPVRSKLGLEIKDRV